jgi:membrane fusion protein (multidrug efflux system)
MRRSFGVAVAVVGVVTLALWRLSVTHERGANTFVPGVRSVGVMPAREREIEDRIEALGTTSSWESIEIRPAVTELIGGLHFSDGQIVAAGDLLVSLVQDEERAKLAEVKSFLDEQEREVKRIESLVARKSLPANQLDERRTLRDVARSRLAMAQAALADRSIRAPFAGVLGLRGASVGALVSPQVVITTLDDIASLRLDFPVPSMLLASLRTGLQVEATTPALPGEVFRGEVIGIDSRVNPVDRSVRVRARLDNRALRLKPGLLMNVLLQSSRRNAVVIPEEAVIHYQREHYVLRVDEAAGNRVERVDIEVGLRSPGFVEVTAGLKVGEMVITEGINSVRPGDVVTPRVLPPPP